jgi:ribosome-associated protein
MAAPDHTPTPSPSHHHHHDAAASVEARAAETGAVAPSRTPRNPGYLIAWHAINAMMDKKAADVVVLDLRGVSGMADFFVLGTGSSDVQIRAMANGVMEAIREDLGERPYRKEGLESLQWVLIDYVDVVVHVFSEAKRAHYQIERLWGEADAEAVPDDGDASDVDLLRVLMEGHSNA